MTKLEWFAGNASALDLYERLVFIAHSWDDLVDRDRDISPDVVNALVMNLLLHLPQNECFRRFETEIRVLLLCGATSYMAANIMEKSGDKHKVEIAHYLRYAVSQVAVFLVSALNGVDKAPAIIAEAMTQMIPERIEDYLKEHAL